MKGGVLRDRNSNPVEFSVVTNAGNLSREKMAAMIQQDLGSIGIKLNVVTLDFASLSNGWLRLWLTRLVCSELLMWIWIRPGRTPQRERALRDADTGEESRPPWAGGHHPKPRGRGKAAFGNR